MLRFTTLKTRLGVEIKVSANHQRRVFTIYRNGSKYKTFKQSKKDFNSNLQNTGDDWNQFLKSTDYYVVQK
jgi:hypothetical protein